MSGKPKPCRFPGCGLVFTPGYYAEHAHTYHEGGKRRPSKADINKARAFADRTARMNAMHTGTYKAGE